MKLATTKAGIVAGIFAAVLMMTPASAGSTGIPDDTGVDYDAACLVSTSPTPPAPNSIISPDGRGCPGKSTYDRSTEGIDLNDSAAAVSLASNASGQFVATWKVDGSVPAAGSTDKAAYDLPDGNFVGGNYFALFQNKSKQTNVAYQGCPPNPPRPTPILQRPGSWKDGYHYFVAFSAGWDGTKWIHSAQLGEYAPDGGFGFFELGTNDGAGWSAANPEHPYGTDWSVTISGSTITVTAPGTYESPDPTNCHDGTLDYIFGAPGDVIANVKGLTTANQVVTLPVTVPLSTTCALSGGVVCETDITTVGGFVFWVDTTAGSSTAGLLNSNISGIALTGGSVGGADTLGPGPTCPTPTVGGALPQNPLFTPDTACHIDDDAVSRGSFLQEYWDTVHDFVF